ncbi:MBL fold metallo-hydrolase [candidate division CSSED10-310 bacterium]|uniref:MBL fold metallo-hydrolase n=1 Tax=candidate division CSSED10-310 bacterium TaxID=2855610 RepID=A0ABV6YR33_UNCC1
MIIVKFWGVRGSIPTPGASTVKYGGNTSCVEVRINPEGSTDSELIIIDAGSGIRLFGDELLKEMPIKASIFFSHVHWDHIQGFPFFRPGFIKGNEFNLYGMRYSRETGYVRSILAGTLRGQQEFPNFPVGLDYMGSEMHFKDIEQNEVVTTRLANVSNRNLVHPGGSVAFRIEEKGSGKAIVYCSDTEHLNGLDKNVMMLSENSSLLIYDSQYTPEEYKNHKGWGHSTWEQGLRLAKELNIPRLVLFHHDPGHSDTFLEEEILYPACQETDDIQVMLAREGMILRI